MSISSFSSEHFCYSACSIKTPSATIANLSDLDIATRSYSACSIKTPSATLSFLMKKHILLCYSACSIKTPSATLSSPVSYRLPNSVTAHVPSKHPLQHYPKIWIKRKTTRQNVPLTGTVFLSRKYVQPFKFAHSARRKGAPASPVLPLIFLLHAT